MRRLQRMGILESEIKEAHESTGHAENKSPDHTFEESARREFLHKAIDSLPIKQRVPLVLNKLQGFTSREIAEILDISPATVEARLHRAKENLKNKLLQLLP